MIGITVYKKKESVKYKDLLVVNKQLKNFDPTRATSLRNSFMRDMDRRFNLLNRDIRQAIDEDDCFGLKKVDHEIKIKNITVHSTPGKEVFKFTTSADKVSQFMSWLKNQEKQGLIQVTTTPGSGTAIDKAWTDMYVQDSYKRGVIRSRYELGKAGMGVPTMEKSGGIGASMSTPFHMDRVGILYARVFEDLKGITSQMDSAISRILSQGIIDGDNPKTLVKKLTDATGISRNRARTLARTEVIRAHHLGAVQEYRNWGLSGVKVQAEWSTAGFNVCPDCASMEGKIFTLDQIEGMIPRHPNCRCMILPVLV
jgi:SPP1 gp7 family putative phage head morphogenesis protein